MTFSYTHSPSRAGTVYLITLLVVLVVAIIAVVMADGAQHRLRVQDTAIAEQQCRQAAIGVMRAAVNDLASSQAAGVLPGLVSVTSTGETVGNCAVVVLGRDPYGQKMVYDLIREAGKIDASNAALPVLMAIPGMTDEVAAAIMDWRDVDEEVYNDIGAEAPDAAYQGAPVPYAPRNGPFQTADELRLVRGVTDNLFFGEDANHNGRLDPGEDRDGNGQLTLGLRDLMSVDNREPATNIDGEERIEIVSDPRRMRQPQARLIGLFGEERGNILAEQMRNGAPFANRLDFVNALTLSDDEILVVWNNFKGAEGRLGLIDAWSVPESILRNLVSSEIANAILAARPATFTPNPAWLVRALNRAQTREAGAYLTSGSYQFRADIIAVENSGAGWHRLEARIDCSNGTPYLSQLRSTNSAGWPFPWISPQQLRRQVSENDLLTLLTTERN